MYNNGDLLILNNHDGDFEFKAQIGATAIFKNSNPSFIRVEWIRNGKDNGQSDGGYYPHNFRLFKKNNKTEYKGLTNTEDFLL